MNIMIAFNTTRLWCQRMLVCGIFVLVCSNTAFDNLATAQIQQKAVDMWILGGRPEADYRSQIVQQGNQKVSELKNALESGKQPLTEEQESKLKLVVEGVASRALQDVAIYRAATDKFDLNNQNDQQNAVQILNPAMQLRQTGWFGKQSMFASVMNRVLNAEQTALINAHALEVRKRQDHALALQMVASLDERVGLLQSQREKLVELIDKQNVKELPEHYERFRALLKLMRVPEKDLQELLDEKQQEKLKAATAQYQNIEAALR